MATRHGPHPDAAPFLSQADETEADAAEGGSRADGGQPEVGVHSVTGISYSRSVMIVAVLCYINLLNYMDRFTVAGILPDIESFFRIGDSSSGLLQTVFMSSYMVLAPIFGYLGDRYHRKRLLCLGIAFWSAVTLGSSFIPQEVPAATSAAACWPSSTSPSPSAGEGRWGAQGRPGRGWESQFSPPLPSPQQAGGECKEC
uniref:Protein spinster homolog 1 n=1 Tax=Gopherus agassizii TaxID=38772 RepID=A0A452GYS0_9SAUR